MVFTVKASLAYGLIKLPEWVWHLALTVLVIPVLVVVSVVFLDRVENELIIGVSEGPGFRVLDPVLGFSSLNAFDFIKVGVIAVDLWLLPALHERGIVCIWVVNGQGSVQVKSPLIEPLIG
jgi:hypothetical protein